MRCVVPGRGNGGRSGRVTRSTLGESMRRETSKVNRRNLNCQVRNNMIGSRFVSGCMRIEEEDNTRELTLRMKKTANRSRVGDHWRAKCNGVKIKVRRVARYKVRLLQDNLT